MVTRNLYKWSEFRFRMVVIFSIIRTCRNQLKFRGMSGGLVIAALVAAMPSHAGEIEPRAYVNTPVGINFLLTGYAYSDGGLSVTGSSPLEDAEVRMNTGVLAYARSLDILGKSGKIDVILPYSNLFGNAMVDGQPRDRNVTGIHDPLMRFSVNFYGAPALSMEEFADYQQDLILGASLQVSAPLGAYDSDKLVNIGNHRWFVKPDIGISKAWGPFTLEISTGVLFFTDNNDFFGSKTLEQDPIYTSQIHTTFSFGRGIWAALSGTYDYGGRTETNGVEGDEINENSRFGATVAFPVNLKNSIKLFASTGIRTSLGTDFDLAGILWQYRWGNGL